MAGGVAWLAHRAGTLTGSGAVAAWVVGTAVLLGTGWKGGGVLAAFFVFSNLVGRGAPAPAHLDPKGDRRDHRQVLANGGIAALVGLYGLRDPALGHWLLTCALAAAAADTWATAFGARSRRPPRSILGGTVVPAGTSGGVTALGSLGAAAGAMVVSLVGAATAGMLTLFPVASLVGFGGMLLDSALGAAAQGRFRCERCGESSEWRVHRCGAPTVPRGGLAWLDNDGVNLSATAAATAAGWLLWRWFSA